MKWAAVLGIAAILVVMALYEWPKLKMHRKREKIVFATLVILGGFLASLYIFYPKMPGPTQLLDTMYKPLVKIVEQFTQERSG